MLKITVSMGRGGTGKTSFVALTAKYLIETGVKPLLLIDTDPDQNLNEMVGVNLEDTKTISDLYGELMQEGGTLAGITPKERMEGKIWEKGLYEGEFLIFYHWGRSGLKGATACPTQH